MKTLANVLYVLSDGSRLSQKGKTLLLRQNDNTVARFPIHLLENVVCFGRVEISPFAMGLCGKNGVPIALLTPHGRLMARIIGNQRGHIQLRRRQFRAAESAEMSAKLARWFVAAKILNSRNVLQRALRDHDEKLDETDHAAVDKAIIKMRRIFKRLEGDEKLDIKMIRGLEGEAARAYFNVFGSAITAKQEDFTFMGRNRRPPKDPVNALLSFVYALLANDVRAACESVGLDPQMGFLHSDRSGRPALALDLMEELRPILADRLVLSLINRRQVFADGFTNDSGGGVRMTDDTRRVVLRVWQERKRESIRHPTLGEPIAFGVLPHVQAKLLARFLRGDADYYSAFVLK